MRLGVRLVSAAIIATLFSAASVASTQQMPPWPERWLVAGVEFGNLRVAYRLTDDCDIDPDFEITDSPSLDVTRQEILGSLRGFLAAGTRDDPPREVVFRILDDTRAQERAADQPMSRIDYAALNAELEKLGPWPRVRMAPVGSHTYRCTFDSSGALIRLERSVTGEDQFSDFAGDLSEEGPFFLKWTIEE